MWRVSGKPPPHLQTTNLNLHAGRPCSLASGPLGAASRPAPGGRLILCWGSPLRVPYVFFSAITPSQTQLQWAKQGSLYFMVSRVGCVFFWNRYPLGRFSGTWEKTPPILRAPLFRGKPDFMCLWQSDPIFARPVSVM